MGGDLPYSDAQVAGVWNLIADMNAQRLADVFSYVAQIVPANRLAVPAPPLARDDHDRDRD